MSIIRSIKHRLGLSVTPANNFDLDASAENGTMKLARESGQDIMTVDAAGKVTFPQGVVGKQVASVACVFNGLATGTNPVVAGFGAASVTRTGAGTYIVTFSTPFADGNYVALVTGYNSNSGIIGTISATSSNASQLGVATYDVAGTLADVGQCNVVVFKV